MKRRIIGAIIAVSMIAALSSGCVIANNNTETRSGIKVIYDGQEIVFDVEPEIINDRVMVPMRTIFETFGAKVKWDAETQTITSKKKSKTITMTIGETDMTKNDETYTFDTAPVIEGDRTLIPVRALSEMLGLDVEWDENSQTVTIVTPEDEEDDVWKLNTGTIDLTTLKTTGSGVSVSDNVITITEGGDFEVVGTLDDGQIVIDTESKVKLRLAGMSLTNRTGSAIYVKNADKAYITLADGTENVLTDGAEYTSGDENEKATITSRDNLEIKGKGSLTVNGNYKNGIDGADSVEIENGTITINAVNDGIHANDTLSVSGGALNVTAESDGLQADEIVDITGGTVNITTTGDVQASQGEFGPGGMGGREMKDPSQMTDEELEAMRAEMEQWFNTDMKVLDEEDADDSSDGVSSKGIKADWLLDISGGTINVNSTDHAIHSASDIEISGGDITLASEKKKGISGHGNVTIDGGNINITKSTEGIESKQTITVNDGNISVIASDDGFNAGGGGDMFGGGPGGMGGFGMQRGENGNADENGGQNFGRRGGRGGQNNNQNTDGMTPPEMGEGMTPPEMGEGMMPPEMGDGMTPPEMGEGMTPPERNGGMGGGPMGQNRDSGEISAEHHIQINGGTIYINAMGDGIDSNGSIVINGGKVTVDGTTSGGNSALDHDGTMMVNGGELIAVSAIGMVEAPGSYSTQNVLNYTLSESVEAGTEISVKNSKGETIVTHKSANAYQSFIFSSDELKTGETYTIYVGGEEKDTFTVSDVITAVGTATSTGGFGRMGGGRGGQRGQTDMQTQ